MKVSTLNSKIILPPRAARHAKSATRAALAAPLALIARRPVRDPVAFAAAREILG